MAASTHTLIRIVAALSLSIAATATTVTITAGTALASGGDTWTAQGDGSHWTDGDNWSAGVPQDGGSVTIAPTKTEASPHVLGMPSGVELTDLTLTDSSLDGGSVTVTGELTWSVSTGQHTLDARATVQGSASITGPGTKLSLDPLTFEGDTDVSAGLLETEDTGPAITNSGTFSIEPGAAVQGDACCASVDNFINTGTLTVPGTGDATLGLMDLVDQGAISVAQGSQLLVARGQAHFTPGVGLTGKGTVTFEQGTAVTLASHLGIGAGTTLQLTGNATFNGTGGVTGKGDFLWTGGTIFATMDVATKTDISGPGAKSLAAPAGKPISLTLHGATTLSGAGPLDFSQSSITSTGTFTMEPGTAIRAGACCVSPDKFTNLGMLSVPAAGAATIAFADFDDQGTVSVGKGATLAVLSGPGDLAAGKTISGGGTIDFDQNAAIAVAKNVSIGSGTTVQLKGGASFSGTGGFTGQGHLLWTGGTVEGNIDVAVPLVISGTSTKELATETSKPNTLTLRSTTSLTGAGPLDLGGNVTLVNAGTMTAGPGTTIEAGVCCASPDHFANNGTLVIAAQHGQATIAFLALVNSGTVKLASGKLTVGAVSYDQKAGTTNLAGGSLSSSLPVTIDGGTLTGHGTIAASVASAGTVRPTGILTITGSYSQAKKGVFATTIKGSSFGQLVVSGTATLAGTITATASKLGKVKTFKVIRFHARTGKFSTISGKPSYKVSYQGSVQLRYP